MSMYRREKRSYSSSEEDEHQEFKKAGMAASFPAQQMMELQYQLGRAGSALKSANRISMNIGWGAIIPQTPAANRGNRSSIPRPFSPVSVGGVTPVRGGGAGANVTIAKEEYDRLLRNDAKRNQEREGERGMRRNDGGREEGNMRNIREGGNMRNSMEEGNKRNGREEGNMRRNGREVGNMRNGREKGNWAMETGHDEMRHLEGLCGRCGENHATRECTYVKEELWCDYKPCVSKQGHTTQVCHEIMKRCRLAVCGGQRGHRVKSHFRPDGVLPFGKDRRAADELKRHFEEASAYLTGTEKRLIERYENRQERLSSGGGSGGKVVGVQRKGLEEKGTEMTVFKTSEELDEDEIMLE